MRKWWKASGLKIRRRAFYLYFLLIEKLIDIKKTYNKN